jgi:hypothetical protein
MILTGVFRGSPALWAGSSDTIQEINLNYRDAPPCRRGASQAVKAVKIVFYSSFVEELRNKPFQKGGVYYGKNISS